MKMIKSNLDKKTLDTIASYMDDQIREECHSLFAPCAASFFLEEYCKRDKEFLNLLVSEFRDILKHK
jgi:hypothetical protein